MKEGKDFKLFSETYQEKRIKYLGHLLRQIDEEPEKFTTVHQNIPLPFTNPIRRVGAPRVNWTEEVMKLAWKTIYEDMEETDEDLDTSNPSQIQALNLAAHTYMI